MAGLSYWKKIEITHVFLFTKADRKILQYTCKEVH